MTPQIRLYPRGPGRVVPVATAIVALVLAALILGSTLLGCQLDPSLRVPEHAGRCTLRVEACAGSICVPHRLSVSDDGVTVNGEPAEQIARRTGIDLLEAAGAVLLRVLLGG